MNGKDSRQRRREKSGGNTKRARMPAYLERFSCIGPACEDNCCIGWDVEFDKKSYRKYLKISDPEIAAIVEKNVYINRCSFSAEVDHAKVRLKKDKRCPFLDDGRLCLLQARLGEDWLSNVCASYPRYTNDVDGVLEHSGNMSCPEIARLALQDRNGIRFIELPGGWNARHIVSTSIRTGSRDRGILECWMPELRRLSIDILQDRRRTLPDRLALLVDFFADLQRFEDAGRIGDVPRLAAEYRCRQEAPTHARDRGMNDLAPVLVLVRELIDRLNVYTEVDSRRYVAFMEDVLKGIQYNRKAAPEENAKRYGLAQKRYFEPFLRDDGHIIENYLVNFMFGNLFPALEVRRAFDPCVMLILLYALVKFHLTGLAACHRGLPEATAVAFLQVFSKTVEHHKTYLETITEHVRRKRCNTPEFVRMLIYC